MHTIEKLENENKKVVEKKKDFDDSNDNIYMNTSIFILRKFLQELLQK